MEADGARFLWLDEYRRREIFGEFASPEERGRWSATLEGTLSDAESTEANDTGSTRGHRRRARFEPPCAIRIGDVRGAE